ncbi:MAG TPA: hypothetical protein VNO26_16505 [Candidatus Limnocylindria bacterium]|nr:hypothetical protein [Candidatus Limnocylindria bacterium]
MKTPKLLLGVALTGGLLAATPALALLIPGGPTKSATADCYGELSIEPLDAGAVTLNPKGVPTVTCADGDDTCDADTRVDGTCTFNVTVCIDQTNVPECTPPAGLDKLTASGKAKGVKGKLAFQTPQLLEGSACGAFVEFKVPVKSLTKAGKGTVKIKAKAPKGTKPRSDADKIPFVCNPSPPECDASGRTVDCPANPAGGPDQLTLVVAQTGNDLDNGWTGISQNFAVTPNGSLNVCLSECDATSDTLCTANGAVGEGTPNGATFGAPLPLLASNVPVCVVNRFNEPITGQVDYATGDIDLRVTLLSDVFFTNASEVCPRCNGGRCTSGKNIDKACTVDATLFVAEGEGQKNYNLSEDCPPLGNPVATLNILFDPLTSGDTGPLSGGANPPCPRTGGPGINPQPNACAQGCGSVCTGAACVERIPNPVNPEELVCLDNKGGISQVCCNDNTARACFPLENGGTLSRVGRAEVPIPAFPDDTFPKTGTGTVASVFCEAATGNSSIDGTTGLPGPAALLLSGCQYWLKN